MIQALNKKECCGCGACVHSCVRSAISMRKDEEGFLYPKIDADLCIDCGVCVDVCPFVHQYPEHKPSADFAAFCENSEIRNSSSSGGIFTLLALQVLKQSGYVFGASFDANFSVSHIYIDNLSDLRLLRGSKYLQSDISDSYKICKDFLLRGKQVLFSGTPCQISGLRHFLRKKYDNLITVDFICHGVPSPDIWRCYISNKKQLGESNISDVFFRDKTFGWKSFSLKVLSDDGLISNSTHKEDPYMRLFLSNVILRPSCYDCQAKSGKSGSDITLGDFWGIENVAPEMDDNMGTSIVMVNTEKGRLLFDEIDCVRKQIPHDMAISFNNSWSSSVAPHLKREYVFSHYKKWKNFEKSANHVLESESSFSKRLKQIIRKSLRYVLTNRRT